MGYHQHIIISTVLDAVTRTRALQSAHSRWPFLRNPRRHDIYADRLLLAPPELTDYLFDHEEEEEIASEQCFVFATGLPTWSQEFPDIIFAHIESDCFGGVCDYSGFACQAGNIIERVEPSPNAHVKLLHHVGHPADGIFIPFKRAFFEGRCSGLSTKPGRRE